MSDNVIKPDDYINLEMTKLFKALLEEYINKGIGEEILLEDYNKLSEEDITDIQLALAELYTMLQEVKNNG